jgi:hypothetical protein
MPSTVDLADIQESDRGYLDEVVVRMPFYEPNSSILTLTVGDLAENVMATGSVGCGKSCGVINRILDGAMRFRANSSQEKIGMLVLDFKGDDTVEKVRALARSAGREEDLVIIDGYSPSRLRFFAAVHEFEQICELVSKIESVEPPDRSDNQYWIQARRQLITSLFTLLLATKSERTFMDTVQGLQGYLSFDQRNRVWMGEEGKLFIRMTQDETLPENLRVLFQATCTQLESWAQLDPRTASNLLSCVLNLLNPLFETNVMRYLGGGLAETASDCVNPQCIIDQGKVVVLSISSGQNPRLAALIGSFIKADFYAAVARRNPDPKSRERLVLLVMDEYPLVATGMEPSFGDIPVLQTGRSRRMGVVAATQGLTSLALRLGLPKMQGVMLNFLTQFYMRGNDPLTDLYANRLFGCRTVRKHRRLPPQENTDIPSNLSLGSREPTPPADAVVEICPPGLLSSLQPFQTLIKTNAGIFTPETAWIEPLHIETQPQTRPQTSQPDRTRLLSSHWNATSPEDEVQ